MVVCALGRYSTVVHTCQALSTVMAAVLAAVGRDLGRRRPQPHLQLGMRLFRLVQAGPTPLTGPS